MSYEESIFNRVSKFLHSKRIKILKLLINLLIGAWGYFLSVNYTINIHNFLINIHWIILLIVIILNFLDWNIGEKTQKELETLEKTLEAKKEDNKNQAGKIQILENKVQILYNSYYEICDILLANIFLRLKFGNNERISLYKFKNEKFYIIGRYSLNTDYNKKNREFYKKEGLIAKAWNEGLFFKTEGIPEFQEGSKKKYYDCLRNISDIDTETLKKISMKSRSFYLKAFNDISRLHRSSIIVVESTRDNVFNLQEIDSIIKEEEEKLITFIEKIDWKFPILSNAEEKGF